ncbi:MAG: BatA and WFA domain-containing protein [Planctomycetaceae bacterium]|nr:BatA and WFA domain-containing protein [Planctomycetaceae bacterium]
MSWLSQFFLNPGFILPGAALLSVPIIIHLLSRLRYKHLRFAAMEFLLQSDELNRRRLIIEQLLLLLLRVLLVLLLVLLIARLVLDPSGLLLLRGATTHHVLILDDSLSMRRRLGESTVFAKAVETLETMLTQAGSRRGAVRITLMTTSQPNRPLVTDREPDTALLQELTSRLHNLTCSWKADSPVAALKTAEELLSGKESIAPQVHVLTDLCSADWLRRPEVTAAVKALESADAEVQLIQITDEPASNVLLSELTADTFATAAGIPWRLNLTFHNYGTRRAAGLRATVLVDGKPLPIRILVPDIEANAQESLAHDVTFESAGRHSVEVRLEDDSLTEDNSRFLVVEVADKRSVLIVDDHGRQEDAGYVSAALSADPQLTGVTTDLRTSDVLTSATIGDYDCIYLLNIRELPADAVQVLASYVRDGGGIVWFPDDQANTTWYNTVLRDQNLRLFPVQLTAVNMIDPANVATGRFPHPVFAAHPIFSVYNIPDSPFAETVQVSQWFAIADEQNPNPNPNSNVPADSEPVRDVQTLIRLTDGSPVAFEHQLGRGRVLTFLTTAGKRWTNWPVAPASPGYVVMHLLMHQYLQKPPDQVRRMELGDSLRLQWPLSRFTESVEVFLPTIEGDTSEDTFLRLQAAPLQQTDQPTAQPNSVTPRATGAGDVAVTDTGSADATDSASVNRRVDAGDQTGARDEEQLAISIPQADRPGVYRIRRFDPQGEGHEMWIAMSVPVTESDPALADPAELQQQIGTANLRIVSAETVGGLAAGDAGRELRWVLLSLLVVVMLCEQLLSLRLSFHPETAG